MQLLHWPRLCTGVAIIPMTSNRTVTPSYPDFEDESEENMEREMNASVYPFILTSLSQCFVM